MAPKVTLPFFLVSAICVGSLSLFAQEKPNYAERQKIVIGTATIGTTASLLALNQLWYADFDRSGFHWFNDSKEWMQMDKVGHMLSAYHIGMAGHRSFRWAGIEEKKAIWWGGSVGFGFLLGVEILDGFSAEWGASATDLLANATGSLAYISQELIWQEQRITPKFSFGTSPYAGLAPEKLGSNFIEQSLKDYNGQTYWLSVNLHSFMPDSRLPKWLNIAAGTGAEGLLSANPLPTGNSAFIGFERYRQYYLALDADLWRIPTNRPWIRTVLRALSFIKVPAPGLELNEGKLYFTLGFTH